MNTSGIVVASLLFLVLWLLALWAGYKLGATKGRKYDGLVLAFFLGWPGVVITAILSDRRFGRQ